MSEEKKIKVFMGLPSVGTVCDSQSYTLRELEENYKDKVQLVYPKLLINRVFHDFARNEIVKEFLASDCDVLWFLDSDIAPNRQSLDLITKHWDKWKVAGCPYPVFMTSQGEKDRKVLFCVYKADGDRFYPSDIPYEGCDFVAGVATGCLFIKREVFSLIEAPWFEFVFDEKTREPKHGEDIMFCRKARAKGLQFFVDYSLVAKHYKNLCLLEINNYAINMRNQAILAYDSDVRSKVEQLETLCRKLLAERKQFQRVEPEKKSGIILLD